MLASTGPMCRAMGRCHVALGRTVRPTLSHRSFSSKPTRPLTVSSRGVLVARTTTVQTASLSPAPTYSGSRFLYGQPRVPNKITFRGYATINGVQATELTMPSLSPTMEQGNISKWTKKEGDLIKTGDVIAEIETDKATLEFEMVEQGYLAKILRPDGSKDVKVGDIIAIIVDDPANIDKVKSYTPATASAAGQTPKAAEPAQAAVAQPSQPTSQPETIASAPSGRVFASPLARSVATQLGVDIKSVPAGTGPNARIIKADVEEFVASAPAVAQPAVAAPTSIVTTGQFVDLPLSNVRKVIASRLLESKQNIPHYYLSVDCRMDNLMKVRANLNADGKDSYKLSVNDFIIKAAALACAKVPQANSSWMNTHIRQYNTVDMSVAVQTDFGLITPIIKDADRLGLVAISNKVKQLAAKARDNKLAPHEFQGGTFTISNLGMFGVKQFSAIINPPQACILAVGTSEERLVPSKTSDKPFDVANFMSVTLSCDHRVVDGAVGANWLQEFKRLIEDPLRMLL